MNEMACLPTQGSRGDLLVLLLLLLGQMGVFLAGSSEMGSRFGRVVEMGM